jgi:hypothetical protein
LTVDLQSDDGGSLNVFSQKCSISLEVVGEEVAGDLDVLIADVEVRPKEFDEEPRHFGIRVCETDLVTALRAFSPIEHAARDM